MTVSQPAAASSFAAVGAAPRLRCLAGWHAWSTWGPGQLVDVQWLSLTVVRQRGWESLGVDSSDGALQSHQAQDRTCVHCGKRERRYFWPSPEARKSTLEYGGGGYMFMTYRNAVACGLFAGPPPAGVDFARLDDAVLPMFRDGAWPEPVPVLLACRLGLYHFRRYNPEPRFQYERICPFCNRIFWL